MTTPDAKKLLQYRISKDEYKLICDLLGREPKPIEWPLFSSLWSEHCSYKSSKIHLRNFAKTTNKTVVTSEGENAGIVDLGDGERVAFKMESHNHPSYIEPYQGAATGVGGILRDIFTMGARPIALADCLFFGEPEAPRMKTLVDGVVRGISGYGNCVGVPTVTGNTEFDGSYNRNILVNAMAVGLFKGDEKVALSAAKGPGNFVVYVGAKTGKDGVHGAAMASEAFGENNEAKKPNVQIGDPYFEKLLIESCLEVLQQDLVVAIQDMGAAGLTSSSFEMASKGNVGMRLDLSRVPLRDSSMTPEEILLSESQERMLLVCEPAKFSKIQSVFAKWGLDAAVVGEILSERKVRIEWHNECLTEIDPNLLVENAPRYERPYSKWSSPKRLSKKPEVEKINFQEKLNGIFASPRGGSKEPIFRQYDQKVGAATARGCESNIAFVRLPSKRGLSVATGCRPWLMQIDARLGALDAVVYPALQMAVKGAEIRAVTDCLNFGNPEKPHIMSEFVASVEALTEAAVVFEAPVVSGNVSFYNETESKNITSTPATGMIGLRPSVEKTPSDFFQKAGNAVYLLTLDQAQIFSDGFTGDLDLRALRDFQKGLIRLEQTGLVRSSRVVGRYGLLPSLVKSCFSGLGFSLEESAGLREEDCFVPKLYQVLIEGSSELSMASLQKIEGFSKTQMVQIGRVTAPVEHATAGQVKLGNELQLGSWGLFSVTDLQARFEGGFLSFMR